MTDGIIKGTGNSRFLKGPANAAALYPDFESFRDAWAAGTLPIDLNGINPAGWETQGMALNKANLLTDALCNALGLPTAATPTQAMEKLRQLTATAQSTAEELAKNKTNSLYGYTKDSGSPITITTTFAPKVLMFTCKANNGNLYIGISLVGFSSGLQFAISGISDFAVNFLNTSVIIQSTPAKSNTNVYYAVFG